MSIKEQIIEFLKDKEWVFGGQIEDYIRQIDGTKASNCSRRCRELVRDNQLNRRLVNFQGKNVVQYRWLDCKATVLKEKVINDKTIQAKFIL